MLCDSQCKENSEVELPAGVPPSMMTPNLAHHQCVGVKALPGFKTLRGLVSVTW